MMGSLNNYTSRRYLTSQHHGYTGTRLSWEQVLTGAETILILIWGRDFIIHWFYIVQFVILEVLIKNRYPIGLTIIHVYTTKYISISMFISRKRLNIISNFE